MKLTLRKTGGAVDLSGLTAIPGDVAEGDKFYGAGSDYVQIGQLKRNDVIKKKLGPNETYNVPPGIIPPGSYVYQDIPTHDGMIITPGASGGMAGVGGQYMTGDITVAGVENLVPENIRGGAFIGTVGGNFRGYVNNDQLTPYWYGVFPPGQSGFYDSALKQLDVGSNVVDRIYAQMSVDWQYPVDDAYKGSCIRIEAEHRENEPQYFAPMITFKNGVEIAVAKSFTINYILPSVAYNQTFSKIYLTKKIPGVFYKNWLLEYNSELKKYEVSTSHVGDYVEFPLYPSADEKTWRTDTYAISNPEKYNFIIVVMGRPPANYYMDPNWMKIRSIKFNQ